MVPYLAFTAFANALNYGVWRRNDPRAPGARE
jgi:tryptophan-rich sensory protein